jgi:hypothetical protein
MGFSIVLPVNEIVSVKLYERQIHEDYFLAADLSPTPESRTTKIVPRHLCRRGPVFGSGFPPPFGPLPESLNHKKRTACWQEC